MYFVGKKLIFLLFVVNFQVYKQLNTWKQASAMPHYTPGTKLALIRGSNKTGELLGYAYYIDSTEKGYYIVEIESVMGNDHGLVITNGQAMVHCNHYKGTEVRATCAKKYSGDRYGRGAR
jgi:hypothetical protein